MSVEPMGWTLWSYRLVRWMIAGVFIYSGIVKVQDIAGFAEVINAYGVVPWQYKTLTAVVLSWLELAAGIGLALDVRGSLGTIAAMLILFMLVLGYGIHLGLDIDCGCFGADDPVGKALHGLKTALAKDVILMAGVVTCYVWRYKSKIEPVSLFRWRMPWMEKRRCEE